MSDEKTSVKEVMNAFEEFKATNDTRLAEIAGRGADPVTEAKLQKIEATLIANETKNQEMTLAAKQAEKVATDLKALEVVMAKLEAKMGRPGLGLNDTETKAAKAIEYKAAFNSYVRDLEGGGVTADERKVLNEYKVVQAGNDVLGGYYLSPAEMAAEIIKNVILQSPIRSLARVTTIGAPSLKLPKRTGTFAATRVGELDARNETQGYTTGMVEINAPEMYAQVNISQQMIEDSMFDIENEMMLEFSEQFAVKEGTEFVVGTGTNNQAEGFMTSSAVTTGFSGSATTIADVDGQADGLIKLFYNGLKTAYAKNATWVMNRQTLGSVRRLKDAQKQYIWQPGVAGNVPNTIIGASYVEVPDMPNEGAGLYPIAVGDFTKGYRIVDRVLISVLRDPFTVANAGQILYRARKRVGGAVVKGEAIAKMRCATS